MSVRSRHPEPTGTGAAGASTHATSVYWSGRRIAVVFDHRIEFYVPPKGVSLFFEDGGLLRRLGETFPNSGQIAFFKDSELRAVGSNSYFKSYRGGNAVTLSPTKAVSFREPIGRPPHAPARRESFLVCTDPWLGEMAPEGDQDGFCGAFDVSGQVVFQIPESPAGRRMIEPLGLSDGGDEALFAINEESAAGGTLSLKEYLLWRKSSGFSTLPLRSESPEVKSMIKKYAPEYYMPYE